MIRKIETMDTVINI